MVAVLLLLLVMAILLVVVVVVVLLRSMLRLLGLPLSTRTPPLATRRPRGHPTLLVCKLALPFAGRGALCKQPALCSR